MHKPSILVINNTAEQRQNVVELLTLAGYNTLVAENGKKGLELLTKHDPDLILCAVAMPKLDGFGVLRAIHNIPHTINIPFIFLSSKADAKDLRKGMNLGADDFLIMPTDEDLLEVISIQLKKSGRIMQQFGKGNKKTGTLINGTDDFSDIFSSSSYKVVKKVKSKQPIYMEGDSVNFIFYLVKGKVKTFRVNEGGKEIITGLFGEGDIFGYSSFFENFQKESCTAIEQSELIFISREEFLDVLETNNEAVLKFMKIVLFHLLESGDRMLKLAYNSSSKKIAEALTFYSRMYKDGENDFPFDRRDISTLAGVAKESVSRKISYFNTKGLIKINPKTGSIRIPDHSKMDKLKS